MLPINEMHSVFMASAPYLRVAKESFVKRALPEGVRCFLRYRRGELVGFASVHENGLTALAVDPAWQRQGIGSDLLGEAEEHIRNSGFDLCVLGRTRNGYLCQGAPYLGQAREYAYFAKRGYAAEWSSVDMAMHLRDFDFPSLSIRPAPEGTVFRPALLAEMAKVRDAVARTEPFWTQFYTCDKDVFVAETEGEITGFVLVMTEDLPFANSFSGAVGGLGCLGVVPDMREKGIGLQLAARATERLAQLHMDVSYLGYTWLEDWYGSLGYKPFARFWMGEKRL